MKQLPIPTISGSLSKRKLDFNGKDEELNLENYNIKSPKANEACLFLKIRKKSQFAMILSE